jgi:mycofactocin system transcriptional regulator
VARTALRLFAELGFDECTVEDIADALGISRRTLFRYYPSKNDIVWGDFDWVLDRLRACLAQTRTSEPLMNALRRAVVASNTYPADALPELRIRMTLITSVPALQAHSWLRYREWREVIAEWAAQRTGTRPQDHLPQTLAFAALGTSISAFRIWVENPAEDLIATLDEGYRLLGNGFRRAGTDAG